MPKSNKTKNSGRSTRTAKASKSTAPARAKRDSSPAAQSNMKKSETRVEIKPAKGRPMLTWVGKKPLRHAIAYPAQLVETFHAPPLPLGEGLGVRALSSSTATTKTCSPTCLPTAIAARLN
jgi:hypothetical protein